MCKNPLCKNPQVTIVHGLVIKTSIEDANEIMDKLNSMSEEETLPSWWTDKITLSANYLNKARDYILNSKETE